MIVYKRIYKIKLYIYIIFKNISSLDSYQFKNLRLCLVSKKMSKKIMNDLPYELGIINNFLIFKFIVKKMGE